LFCAESNPEKAADIAGVYDWSVLRMKTWLSLPFTIHVRFMLAHTVHEKFHVYALYKSTGTLTLTEVDRLTVN